MSDLIEQLMVKDYILFDYAMVDFEKDMSVITGETGAGKSLLIDAIGYVCGDRITSNIVRKGKEKAILQMVLSRPNEAVCDYLEENGFEVEDELIVQRTITSAGKSSIRINQQITTLNFVRQLMHRLIDIHSQMDTIQLMNPVVQMDVLDQYAHVDALKETVKSAYTAYSLAKRELNTAKQETFSDAELDFLTSQMNEIEAAEIQENEYEQLQERIKIASRAQQNLDDFDACTYAFKHDNGILDQLYSSYKIMKKNDLLKDEGEVLHTMYYQLMDLAERLNDQKESYQNEVNDLDAMQDREYFIKKMFRKYGGSFASMMEYKQSCMDKIERIIHRQDVFEKLEKEEKRAYHAYVKQANALTVARKAVLSELETAIESHCKDLMLENAKFKIQIDEVQPTSSGMDAVEFLVSMNPGQPLTPLKQSASGGELSRLMLALKTVFQTQEGIDTILFDEIDTGVSGKVALAMGSKMHALAQNHQVLCITHLASVAVWAQHHYCVSKSTDGLSTLTSIRQLEGEDVLKELAIMSNGTATHSAIESMRELQNEVHNG